MVATVLRTRGRQGPQRPVKSSSGQRKPDTSSRLAPVSISNRTIVPNSPRLAQARQTATSSAGLSTRSRLISIEGASVPMIGLKSAKPCRMAQL